MPFIGSGPNLTSLNASNLASGTVPTARMPTYVSTVNGQSGAVTVTVDTTSVLNATAGASAGDVGTYGFMKADTGNRNFGSTAAGSLLNPWGENGGTGYTQGPAQSGTWRAMGSSNNNFAVGYNSFNAGIATLWLRIA